jgi:hypothetical protein
MGRVARGPPSFGTFVGLEVVVNLRTRNVAGLGLLVAKITRRVRYGPKADMSACTAYVRFRG